MGWGRTFVGASLALVCVVAGAPVIADQTKDAPTQRAAGEGKADADADAQKERECRQGRKSSCRALVPPADRAAAGPALRDECNGGAGRACHLLAVLLATETLGNGRSEGATVYFDKAEKHFRVQCDTLADRAACRDFLELARLYQRGTWVERDARRAYGMIESVCGTGDVEGCFLLASSLETGAGVVKDELRAERLFERGCDRGLAAACARYSARMARAENFAQMARYDGKACRAEPMDAASCAQLGASYLRGRGVAKSAASAEAFFGRACDAGLASACRELATLYLEGTVTPRDKTTGSPADRAHALYRRACDADDARSCSLLAEALRDKSGAWTRPAVALLERACALDDAAACFSQARALESGAGPGGGRNARAALDLDAKACKLDHAGGCLTVARALAAGSPAARKNAARAVEMGQRACDLGRPQGCSLVAWISCHDRNECTEAVLETAKRGLAADQNGELHRTYAYVLCAREARRESARQYARACALAKKACETQGDSCNAPLDACTQTCAAPRAR